MTDQEVQYHRQDQQSLANLKMAIWALALVVLVPGAGSLVYMGAQIQRVSQNEKAIADEKVMREANTRAIRNLETGNAAIDENLINIKESLRRTERMLEQLVTGGRN